MPATYRADRDIHRRLRHSAWKGQVDIAKRMIKRGADVEGADGDGFTPLLIASRWGRLDMLKYLVEELKVDLTVTNEEGNSAHNLAVIYHFDEVAEYLASQGCSTTPNGLTLKRQESADAWLAQVMPPTDEEIEKLRDTVESTYSELRQSSSSGGADGPSEAARQVAAISAATGLDEEGAKRNAEEEVVGQQTFPVAQKAVKKAPRHCRLGVGSMGLALFDGVRPVATWPYSLVAEVAVKSVKASGELHVTVTAGKKQKRIVFQTMHAAKLHALIQERRQELSISPPPSAPGSPDPEVAAGAGASEAAGEAAEGGAGGSEGGAVAAAAAAAAAAAERAAMPAGPAPPERLDIQPAPAPAPAAEVGRTLWVGGIPDNLLPQLGELSTDYGQQVPPAAARASATPPSTSTGGGGDLQTSALAAKFAAFGTITSLTMRRKLGVNKSWAFVTFTSPEAATAALAAKIEHVDQRGTSCVLQLRTADVEEQLRSPTTGALAGIWQKQQEKEAAWMASLLQGLNQDKNYQAAKATVAKRMGLRAEELEDELEAQELQQIQQIALSVVDDLDDAPPAIIESEPEPEPEAAAAAGTAAGGALGRPPKGASPRPQLTSGDDV